MVTSELYEWATQEVECGEAYGCNYGVLPPALFLSEYIYAPKECIEYSEQAY